MKCINKLKDDQYELNKITHTRIISRAILINDENQICLLKIFGDDDFGHRDYLETPGGGVKENESLIDAAIREVKEEVGVEFKEKDAVFLKTLERSCVPPDFKDIWIFRKEIINSVIKANI